MLRLIRSALLALALLLLALSAFGFWLTRTDGGRDFVLTQIQQQLPENARLRWQSASGQLATGLRFRKTSYLDATQSYSAETLSLRISLTPLLLRRVQIDELLADGVRVQLPSDDTPFEFPRWPQSLPTLDLPIGITVSQFSIGQIELHDDKQLLYALNRVQGDIDIRAGALRIQRIQADSVHGRIELTGYYLPKKSYNTALQGRIVLNTDSANAKPALQLSANGNAERFVFDISGALPEQVRVRWQLSTENKAPSWLLSASSERFEPSRLGIADNHYYRVQLAASGTGQRAQLVGELSRDGQTVIIEPSQLALADDWIVLEQVRAQFAGAQFSAEGRLARSGELASDGLKLSVRNYRLPLPEDGTKKAVQTVWLDANLQASGRLTQWRARGDGQLRRGDERADFVLSGTGTDGNAVFPQVQVNTVQGGLQGRVTAAWKPSLAFGFDGQLQRFDPSYFLADFPGAVDAQMQVAVQSPVNKPWQGTVKIQQLGGSLRGRALGGTADVSFEGLAVAGIADVRVGASKLLLKGSEGKTRALNVKLSPLDLADLHPDWRGRVQGSIEWLGRLDNPQFQIDLNGEGLQAMGYSVGSVQWQANSAQRRLSNITASAVRIGEQSLSKLDVQLEGQWPQAVYQISAASDQYAVQSTGRVRIHNASEIEMAIAQLNLNATNVGQWQLQAPMVLRAQGADYRFTPFCLGTPSSAARLCAEEAGTNIAVRGQDFPLALLEPWLNNVRGEFSYNGSATINAQLPKSFDFAGRGFAELQVPSMKIGVKPNTDSEVARLENVNISAEWLAQQVNAKLSADLPKGGRIEGALSSGFSESAPLRANLKLQMYELSWLELFSLDIAQPTGQINGEIEIIGSRAAPVINGSYRLQDFSVQIPALGLKLSDGQITATSRDNLALLVRGSIKSGEGRMKVVGVWDPVDQLPQPIDLRLTGKNVSLADTPDLQLIADTDLFLGYSKGLYSLNGDVDLVRGLVNLESLDSAVSISSDVVVLDPLPEKAQRDLLRLSLQLKVSAADQVKVSGYGLNGNVSGKILVNSPYDSPTKLTGTLSLLGQYQSYGQNLQIKRGNIEYANSLIYEPRLDILTERQIDTENITVGLQITGYASKPKTRVVASQSMTDTEALSWLLFGQPLVSVSAGQASTLNARSMALNAGGSLLVGTLGRQIGLDQASISGSRALGDSTLTIGKQLSPKFFVSYGVSLLGIGQIITLKYLLKKGLDISIETEQTDLREQSSAALNWRK